ncbi:hypothetical protein H5410_038901 [Solanum commersonii]|uniref:F-box domain-containing protein n=1 Tax=Solanum commersonii TaxID=4109 RepID=A0A9J5YC20_SOLCO|nr:hypothetical protein H5410_038901 [Solanum commersonii]
MDIDWAIEIYFPEEIIVEILIRLPVQSLLRFKCASKFWKTLITSDHFKAKHYNYAKNNKKILITRWHPDHTTSYYCSSLSSPQPLQKLGCCPSNNKPNRYEVLCCCDGLSLLHFFYDYLLWNPSTNESIQLPYIDYQESIRSTFGLGYDSISDGYKILKIDNSGDDSRPPSKILALKSGSWRKIDNHPRIFHNSTYRDGPLTFIPLPEGICNIPNMAFIKRDVSVIEGMLCAYCSCLHARAAGDTFKLWVMKDYDDVKKCVDQGFLDLTVNLAKWVSHWASVVRSRRFFRMHIDAWIGVVALIGFIIMFNLCSDVGLAYEQSEWSFRAVFSAALMGVSGAGKTTLMDVLRKKKRGGYIDGDINIYGYPEAKAFARIYGYCERE